TIDVAGVGRIHLLGIAAPRPAHRAVIGDPLAYQARERLASLVLHRWVRLEDGTGAGTRRGAYVVLEDGTFVNAVLAREGLARVTARDDAARSIELRRAEREAQMFRRGIWRK